MSMRDLLGKLARIDESMKSAEKKPTGPKFPGYWKGTDKASQAKNKMVGGSAEESIIRDLEKALTENPKANPHKLMREFQEFKLVETFNSKQEVIDHFVRQGKSAAAGAAAWERGWRGPKAKTPNTSAPKSPQQNQKYWWQEKDLDEEHEQDPFMYKLTCDGHDKGQFVSKDDAITSGQKMIYTGFQRYSHIEVQNIKTGETIWQWNGKKDVDEEQQKRQDKENLAEFAPTDDGGSDEDDVLFEYAKLWYNGNEQVQQKIEAILAKSGWEIGEIESEEGGVFVVQSGDEHGKSYVGFPASDLTSLNEYGGVGGYGAANTAPTGTTVQNDPAKQQAAVDAQQIKNSTNTLATTLNQQGAAQPLNKAKFSDVMTKLDNQPNAQLSAQELQQVTPMAVATSKALQNPQTAGQMKQLISKSDMLDKAKEQKVQQAQQQASAGQTK